MTSAAIAIFEVALDREVGPSLAMLVGDDERLRAARITNPVQRQRFLAAHIALRLILSEATGQPPSGLRLDRHPHGKPFLPNAPGCFFNLSHSAGLALVAVSTTGDVGVDIEVVDAAIDALPLAEMYFSPDEQRELQSLPAHDRSTAFFNAWTRKEAYLKGRGDGIAFGLRHFAVTLRPGARAALRHDARDPAAPAQWSLSDIPAPRGFAAALASRGATPAVTYYRFDWPLPEGCTASTR